MATITSSADTKLCLPQVTLCAASSVNIQATLRALRACLAHVDVAACKFFTDADDLAEERDIAIVPIRRLQSARDYSTFLLSDMVDHVDTPYCLVVQWDGHIVNADKWRADFLDYDYIGARWPQFDDGHDVGNGGFSLRSRRLMDKCRNADFQHMHPEDVAIGRVNRDWLESCGMRFAPAELADQFATERVGNPRASFGYHGVFNMPHAIGTQAFWSVYRDLDDRSTVWHDVAGIFRAVGRGTGGWLRMATMARDYVRDFWRKL